LFAVRQSVPRGMLTADIACRRVLMLKYMNKGLRSQKRSEGMTTFGRWEIWERNGFERTLLSRIFLRCFDEKNNRVVGGLRPQTSRLVGARPNMQHYARVEGIGRVMEEKSKGFVIVKEMPFDWKPEGCGEGTTKKEVRYQYIKNENKENDDTEAIS